MQQDDTIVAVSTPPGQGGIAVIRMSGDRAVAIINERFQATNKKQEWEAHRAYHGWIVDGKEPVDEVMTTLFRAPHSYTGQDVVEVSCHGSGYVARRIVELLVESGARPAEPGEFTQRAFLYGKMDLSQAEAVADLIRAKTEAARRVAVYQLEGRLSERIEEMRDRLIHACSLLELELDFGEEDVELVPRDEVLHLTHDIRKKLKSLSASFQRGRICRDGIRMVILGRPNVGKSSILNCLLEKERSIVADTPGTTRDTVEDVLDVEGVAFTVTDTAGFRETMDVVEKEGVRRAERALEGADLALMVFDASEPLSLEDEKLIQKVVETVKPFIPVANKADLQQRLDLEDLQSRMKSKTPISVSALKQKGIDGLIHSLERAALSGGMPCKGEAVLTNVRHHRAIMEAEALLKKAEASLSNGMSQEFVAADLRGALDELGLITGKTTTDDILNRIFSEFCIGK